MSILKIGSCLMLLAAVSNAGYKPLPALNTFAINSYNLKKGVRYVEVRQYAKDVKDREFNKHKYVITAVMQRGSKSPFSKRKLRQFRSIRPDLTRECNIKRTNFCIMAGCYTTLSNAFMLDSNNKMWRLNEVVDIVNILGKIDTLSELKMLLWVNNPLRDVDDRNFKDRYIKRKNGYRVISEYDNSLANIGSCGHFTYKIDVSQNGNIRKKLIKKEPSKHGCLEAD